MKTAGFWVIATLLCTVLVVFGYVRLRPAPLGVDWTVLSSRDTFRSVPGHGQTFGNSLITLSLMRDGIVETIAVESSTSVRRGDTLLILDNREENNRVASAEVEVSVARVELERLESVDLVQARQRLAQAVSQEELAAKRYGRADTLLIQGTITLERFEELKKEYEIGRSERIIAENDTEALSGSGLYLGKARMKQSLINLREARIALSRTVLLAPSDGVVAKVLRAPGEFTASGEALMLFLPSDSLLRVEVLVESGATYAIRPAQRAVISTADAKSPEADAWVLEVGSLSDTRKAVSITLGVSPSVSLPADARSITARIITKEIPGALVLPERFISRQKGRHVVYRPDKGRAYPCAVETEKINEEELILHSGVAAGDTILSSPGLSPGRRVTLIER